MSSFFYHHPCGCFALLPFASLFINTHSSLSNTLCYALFLAQRTYPSNQQLITNYFCLLTPVSISSVIPNGVLSGARLCPDTRVELTCIVNNAVRLTWTTNETSATFTLSQTAPRQASEPPFTFYLNASVVLTEGTTLNATSTLVINPLSDVPNGERITCGDNNKDSVTLNFSLIGNTTTQQLM